MKDILNPKQQIVLQCLLDGKTEQQALKEAGYKSTSRTMICKIRPIYKELLISKQEELIKSTMTREDCVIILKRIAMDDSNARTQIAAIAQLSKICGYETVKTENINSNQLQVQFIEAINPNDTNNSNKTDSLT